MTKKTIAVSGMHCANCALNIEKKLKKTPGVRSANVSYASERASVEFDESIVGERELRDKIAALGYKTIEVEPAESEEKEAQASSSFVDREKQARERETAISSLRVSQSSP